MSTGIINGKLLAPGDVLMVARRMRDKKTGKPYTWRYFFVVTRRSRWVVGGIIVGTTNEKFKDKEITLDLNDDNNDVRRLDMSEWPDGIHAFRMAMVLKGLIPDVV